MCGRDVVDELPHDDDRLDDGEEDEPHDEVDFGVVDAVEDEPHDDEWLDDGCDEAVDAVEELPHELE